MSALEVTTCYATCSIGAKTELPLLDKLRAISSAGFNGIELSFPDLVQYAQSEISSEIKENDYDRLCEAAEKIRNVCAEYNLKIFMLQPFSNFEGWPKGSKEREYAFTKAKGWTKIMLAAGTKLLQIGSSDSSGISYSPQDMADDLAELADILVKDGLSIAYENWCWASRAPYWESVWEVVKICDRSNVGLCLDTFQTAGSLWADPTTESGLSKDEQNQGQDDFQNMLAWNLEKLTRTIPKEKIFIFQISDAYKMSPPLSAEGDDSGTAPKSKWSHDFRPFPFNDGYLPVTHIAQAVFDTGFRGPVSLEVFDCHEQDKYGEDLLKIAKTGMDSLNKLCHECCQYNN